MNNFQFGQTFWNKISVRFYEDWFSTFLRHRYFVALVLSSSLFFSIHFLTATEWINITMYGEQTLGIMQKNTERTGQDFAFKIFRAKVKNNLLGSSPKFMPVKWFCYYSNTLYKRNFNNSPNINRKANHVSISFLSMNF